MVLTSDDEYTVTAQFQNASALVPGNQVVIGARPVGTVEEIRLAPDGQANVTFTVDEEFAPVRRGTVATVRWASLSSVANRQIQLTPPAEGVGEEIPDGGVLTQTETITDVEVDQFFNMLDDKTVKDFKRVIKGFATSYEGVAKQANRGYKYLNPMLYNGRRVFAELNVDQAALESLLVDGSRFAGALADRASDLPQLVHNLNLMMNAIGDRKLELARAISLLPPFMRNANTTFVNLRAALDDVQPLVVAGKPAAEGAAPVPGRAARHSPQRRPHRARPLGDHPAPGGRERPDRAAARAAAPARGRDRLRLTRVRPRPRASAGPRGRRRRRLLPGQLRRGALLASQRRREPELLPRLHAGAGRLVRRLRPLGLRGRDRRRRTGRADGSTRSARRCRCCPDLTDPDSPAEQFSALSTGNVRRCPGSNERPLGAADPDDDSVPFTDGGALTDGVPGDCDPTKVQPGP